MDAFEATLKRGFAETHEPADDGFTVRVGDAVARKERAAKLLGGFQVAGTLAASLSVAWAALTVVQGLAPDVMASLGLELAKAHGAMSSGASFNMATLGGGLTQMLLVLGSLTGGALLYRNTQQN